MSQENLQSVELELDNNCYLCEGPLVEGACPAYNWHDAVHLKNREQLAAGIAPTKELPAREPSDTLPIHQCAVCGESLDADGITCTAINAMYHDDTNMPEPGSMEGLFDAKPLFHSHAEALNAPPISFLIDKFLQREGITGLAAPVRERKSIVALNVAHALLTGQKLFGHFTVVKKPWRVIYLCPEISLGPFMDRVKKIGLVDHVGGKFLCRTLSSPDNLELDDPELQRLLPHSVVILDTAIRFLSGDENSSSDIRAFADRLFALLRNGAEAVLMLHHSPKDMGDVMTLENAMRGSGDLGAFLCCAWGTRLQDPMDPYKSKSFLSNLKQRDFESQDFEVTCGADCCMQYVDTGLTVPNLAPRRAFKGNKDGRDAEALKS